MQRVIELVGLAVLALILTACGKSTSVSAPASPRPRPAATRPPTTIPVAPTSTLAAIVPAPTTTSTPLVLAPTLTPTIRPVPSATLAPSVKATATAVPAEAPVSVISASLRPSTVAPGGPLTAMVNTAGLVGRVELYLVSISMTSGSPQTYVLAQNAESSWTTTITAPSTPGQYHYSIGLYVNGTRRPVVDNDVWNITVSGASPGAGNTAQSLPNDIPLVPPFSYGNPTAATFTAGGHTVNGSEVVSNARPDVASTDIAQFYEAHLPRAGWTVAESSVPSAGAASFSLYATSGNRVCIISYNAATVHIFYGSFTG